LGVPMHRRSLATDEARDSMDCQISWDRISKGAQEIALLDERTFK